MGYAFVIAVVLRVLAAPLVPRNDLSDLTIFSSVKAPFEYQQFYYCGSSYLNPNILFYPLCLTLLS